MYCVSMCLINSTMSLTLAYEREMYVINSTIKNWRRYLLCFHFKSYLVQQSLCGLLSQTVQAPMQYRWLTNLFGFDYEIFCTLGRANIVADGLSQSDEKVIIDSCMGNLLVFLCEMVFPCEMFSHTKKTHVPHRIDKTLDMSLYRGSNPHLMNRILRMS